MATKTLPFRTAYSGQVRHKTEPGRRMQNEYGYVIDKFGRKVLVKTGETDQYETIQEALEDTKIENILQRASIGDMSVFRPDGIYEDLTQLPTNLIEARRAMQNLENLWQEVPQEVKNKYNNNLEEFIGASGSDGWLRDMGLIKEPTITPTTPTPTTKEEGDTTNE